MTNDNDVINDALIEQLRVVDAIFRPLILKQF